MWLFHHNKHMPTARPWILKQKDLLPSHSTYQAPSTSTKTKTMKTETWPSLMKKSKPFKKLDLKKPWLGKRPSVHSVVEEMDVDVVDLGVVPEVRQEVLFWTKQGVQQTSTVLEQQFGSEQQQLVNSQPLKASNQYTDHHYLQEKLQKHQKTPKNSTKSLKSHKKHYHTPSLAMEFIQAVV
jgi:hypothetical protein